MSGSEVRGQISYVPNATLFRAEDGWRYIEETVESPRRRRQLVRIHPSDALDLVLTSGPTGRRFDEWIALILDYAPDLSTDDVSRYISQLIDSQLLVPTLAPTLTGRDPVRNLIDLSAEFPALKSFHAALASAEQRLSAIDRQEVASLCASYKDAAPPLLGLLNGAEERHLFHVDLRRDSPQLGMPASVLREVLNAVEALRRITPRAWPRTALDTFRKRFTDRYGDRVVALMAALDEDSGIGFEVDPGSRRNEKRGGHAKSRCAGPATAVPDRSS